MFTKLLFKLLSQHNKPLKTLCHKWSIFFSHQFYSSECKRTQNLRWLPPVPHFWNPSWEDSKARGWNHLRSCLAVQMSAHFATLSWLSEVGHLCMASAGDLDFLTAHTAQVSQASSVQFSSVAQSCPTLCDPMNCSTPGLPVHHQLPEFTQTHVHQVSDAIQPSHPLSSPSPPVSNPSQHQSLFQWVNSSHEVAKVLEFQL